MSKRDERDGTGSDTPHNVARMGRLSFSEDDVRQWAQEARGRYGVPVRVYRRQVSAGGIQEAVWVAVLWPKKVK